MGRNFVFEFLIVFFKQIEVPQIIIRMGRKIYCIKTLSVVMRNFKNFQKFYQYREKQVYTFWMIDRMAAFNNLIPSRLARVLQLGIRLISRK